MSFVVKQAALKVIGFHFFSTPWEPSKSFEYFIPTNLTGCDNCVERRSFIILTYLLLPVM